MKDTVLRIIPLGGLGEIGKNMMVLECQDDIIVIDAGLMFPEEKMLGVDLVLPDITYLLERRQKVRAILITHGHEDHTGALPYILRQLNVPLYIPRLASGLVQVKLKEHKLLDKVLLTVVAPGDTVHLGAFRVDYFRVTHSIPDAMGLAIRTPLGTVVHTGDFKFDHTPVDNQTSDLGGLAKLGDEGVFLLMSDSTYAELEGYTPSEQAVGATLDRIMGEAPGRVIVATFASLVSRVQQVVWSASKHNRKVVVVGRSMVDTTQMAIKMGYLKVPQGSLITAEQARSLPPEQLAFITTGTQGEPTSVLVRMANRDHRQLQVMTGDTIILSATAIPGNETVVNKTIDNLFRQGANVLYDKLATVHVHGHASREELKLMLSLTKPKFFVPVHGEYRHLALHAKLAETLGVFRQNCFVLEDGDVLELTKHGGKVTEQVQAGPIYVDGLGMFDPSSLVLRDRRLLSRDGIVVVVLAVDKQTGQVVGTPDVLSLGFVEGEGANLLLEKSRRLVMEALDHRSYRHAGREYVHSKVKETLGRFYAQETKRRPLVLPVALEV
jgi:ribonuclease J